jgi:zinc transport system ATP-binding protein
MAAVIEVDDVSFAYNGAPVLEHVSLQIREEEFIGLIGPNAGGKTTLVKLILGLLQPDAGTIRVYGHCADEARTRIGYVPQRPIYNRAFPVSVRDSVLMGTINSGSYFGSYNRRQRAIGDSVMDILDLHGIADQPISNLSGGQVQRVWIARALCSEPGILVLDEPTANIDVRAEEDIFDLLKAYNAHMTILVVSHDIAFISSYVHRVACINRTLVCHDVESISGKTVEELYGGQVSIIHHEHAHA